MVEQELVMITNVAAEKRVEIIKMQQARLYVRMEIEYLASHIHNTAPPGRPSDEPQPPDEPQLATCQQQQQAHHAVMTTPTPFDSTILSASSASSTVST